MGDEASSAGLRQPSLDITAEIPSPYSCSYDPDGDADVGERASSVHASESERQWYAGAVSDRTSASSGFASAPSLANNVVAPGFSQAASFAALRGHLAP